MRSQQQLCADAVDPLEIAAGLEADGVTDRDAARFRHRDVFSLAEELYARAPRSASAPSRDGVRQVEPPCEPGRFAGTGTGTGTGTDMGTGTDAGTGTGAGTAVRWALLPLLPGALCAATLKLLAVERLQAPPERMAVGLVGAAALVGAVWLVLRCVLRARPTALLTLSACWLAGYALVGDRLPAVVSGAAHGSGASVPGGPGLPLPFVLACAVAPAVWGARWLAVRARRGLNGSRGLADFTARMRPLFVTVVVAFTAVLLGSAAFPQILASAGAAGPATGFAGPASGFAGAAVGLAALGLLLFPALLLTAHGFTGAATAGLATAVLLEAATLLAAFAVRLLPRSGAPYRAVETAQTHLHLVSGGVTSGAFVCGCVALPLLAYACHALCRASAHHREPASRP